jgi:hypothetical protein
MLRRAVAAVRDAVADTCGKPTHRNRPRHGDTAGSDAETMASRSAVDKQPVADSARASTESFMTYDGTFDDLVAVPSPNPHSLFTDTEEVDDALTEQIDDDASRFCPSCHRVVPGDDLVCPNDDTSLVGFPPLTHCSPRAQTARSASFSRQALYVNRSGVPVVVLR